MQQFHIQKLMRAGNRNMIPIYLCADLKNNRAQWTPFKRDAVVIASWTQAYQMALKWGGEIRLNS